jgi:hypothetical protein
MGNRDKSEQLLDLLLDLTALHEYATHIQRSAQK